MWDQWRGRNQLADDADGSARGVAASGRAYDCAVNGNYEIAPKLCLLMMLLRRAQWKRLLLAYAAFQQAASERLQKPLGSS
jgi:hypothetical protein